MGMTMSEKILAKHAGLDSVKAGQLVTCESIWYLRTTSRTAVHREIRGDRPPGLR